MLSFILFGVLLLVIAYMGMIFVNKAVLMISFAGVLIAVMALINIIRRKRRIKASINIPISLGEIGKSTKLDIVVYNATRSQFKKIRVRVAYGDRNSPKQKCKWIWLYNVYPGKRSYRNEIDMSMPGSYSFTIKTLRVYDRTGLFYGTKKVNMTESAMILPEIKPISVQIGESVKNFFGDADVYDDMRAGFDPSEIFDVRDYRPGDRLQNVHWKLSAKMDDLIVRENSLPKACPVVLMIDPKGYSNKKSQDFFEKMAALSFSMMDAGCPHLVAWKSQEDKDVVRIRVDDEESYFLFLTRCLIDNEPGVEELYEEKYRRENYIHKMVLWGDGRLTIDDQKQMKFNLEEFELVL